MTLEEFFVWDDGTDTLYELIDHWLTELLRGADASLTLNSVALTVPISELYDGITMIADDEQ